MNFYLFQGKQEKLNEGTALVYPGYFLFSRFLSFMNIPKPSIEGTHNPIKMALRSLAFTNHIMIEKIIDMIARVNTIISKEVNFITA